MRLLQIVGSLGVACVLVACGGSPPDVDPNAMTFETGEFDVPPGDSFECFYLDTKTQRELSAVSASVEQGPGGHHVIVYYTDKDQPPNHHPCNDVEMVSLNQIAGSAGNAQGAEGLLALSGGLAVKVPAGKQLVVQSHYINTTGKTQKATDSITIHTIEPKDVKAYVNHLVVIDESFAVPAQSAGTSVTMCKIERDFSTVDLIGHMHEHGKHYTLERLDGTGNPVETLYDQEWAPEYASHPPEVRHTVDSPYLLKAGTTLRQTCQWNNLTTDPLIFPREMCVAFFYYFPDEGSIICTAAPAP